MTFKQIWYVAEIARCGSISKATKSLFVAQPYLSNMLRQLESEIGILIFKRTSKGVELTEDGREFLGYAKPLLDQKEKVLEMYASQRVHPLFRLSVSMQHFPFVVKAFVEFFHERRPDKYEIHIREVGMHRVINDVYDKKSDVGIIYMSDMSEAFIMKTLRSKGLEFHILAYLAPHVYFSQAHPMAQMEQVSLQSMQDYPFIAFEEEVFVSLDFSEEILIQGFTPTQKRIFIEDRATMLNLLANTDAFTIGTGILPQGYAVSDITSRPISHHQGEVRLGYIHHADSHMSGHVSDFIEDIKRHVIAENACGD